MNALFEFLNSNSGLLLSGAVISGRMVQYIASRWQQRSWISQLKPKIITISIMLKLVRQPWRKN